MNVSTLNRFYVSGAKNPRKGANNKKIPLEEITLIPNKETYEDGDVGEVLIIAPFSPCYGTLTIDCEGTVHISSFEMKSETDILTFPIKKEWLPSITKRPAHATGHIALKISDKVFDLEVIATPSKKKASPAKTEVCLVVVDESVLALAGYQLTSPL